MVSTEVMNNELKTAKTLDDVKKIIKNNPVPTFDKNLKKYVRNIRFRFRMLRKKFIESML